MVGLPCSARNGVYSPGKVHFQGAWRKKGIEQDETLIERQGGEKDVF